MREQARARTRVVVVEDEEPYREMLVSILSFRLQFEVAGSFATGAEAPDQFPSLQPDVVLTDIVVGGGMNGIQLGLKLRKVLPRVGITLLSNHLKTSILCSIPERDMMGWAYLHKAAVKNIGVIERAIAGTADGMVVLDPGIMASAQRT
jgi:DNA-binding NarL/FixJ family response regulator